MDSASYKIEFQDTQQQKTSPQSPLAELAQNTHAERPTKKKKGTDVQSSCSFYMYSSTNNCF